MATKWHLSDIIDLEFLLASQNNDDHDRHKGDRQWYLDNIEPNPDGTSPPDLEVLSAFLTAKRQTAEELPGSVFREFSTLITVITTLLSLLAGSAFTTAALWYDGSVPVNVFRFLGLLLLPQLIFLLFLLVGILFRRTAFIKSKPSILLSLGKEILLKLFFRLKKLARGPHGVNHDKTNTIHEIIKNHSELFFHPVFTIFQLFAIGFNIAALASLLIRVAISDIAFGWQSTLNLSSQFLFNFVHTVSIPWKHFFSGTLPTLAEIEGSRIILKEGISVLANEALTSWWPFLFLTLLFYGLIPRILILIYGLINERKHLRLFVSKQPEINALLHRMKTPYVTSAAKQPAESKQGLKPQTQTAPQTEPAASTAHVLVPEDIQFDSDTFKALIHALGFSPASVQTVEMDWQNDKQIFKPGLEDSDILIILEAWMPPIADTLSYLEKLGKYCSSSSRVYIGLIGKPAQGQLFTPPTQQDISIWQTKIESIHHQNMQLTALLKDRG